MNITLMTFGYFFGMWLFQIAAYRWWPGYGTIEDGCDGRWVCSRCGPKRWTLATLLWPLGLPLFFLALGDRSAQVLASRIPEIVFEITPQPHNQLPPAAGQSPPTTDQPIVERDGNGSRTDGVGGTK